MQQLLGSVMTNPYHLCHTTLIASYPDSAAVGFHQVRTNPNFCAAAWPR